MQKIFYEEATMRGRKEGATFEKQNIAKMLIDEKMILESVLKITKLSLEEAQLIQQYM